MRWRYSWRLHVSEPLSKEVTPFSAAKQQLLILAYSLITYSVPLRKRPIFGGVGAAVENIAATSAPLLGGVLTGSLTSSNGQIQ